MSAVEHNGRRLKRSSTFTPATVVENPRFIPPSATFTDPPKPVERKFSALDNLGTDDSVKQVEKVFERSNGLVGYSRKPVEVAEPKVRRTSSKKQHKARRRVQSHRYADPADVVSPINELRAGISEDKLPKVFTSVEEENAFLKAQLKQTQEKLRKAEKDLASIRAIVLGSQPK